MNDFAHLMKRLTDESHGILILASAEAGRQKGNAQSLIEPTHLLLGMLLQPNTVAGRVLGGHGMTVESVRYKLGIDRFNPTVNTAVQVYSKAAKKVFYAAVEFSDLRDGAHKRVTSGDLLHALMVSEDVQIEHLLSTFGTTSQMILHDLLN